MPIVYSLITCSEEAEPARQSSLDGVTGKPVAKVTLRVAHALADELVADILGNRNVWPHAVAGSSPVALNATTENGKGGHVSDGQGILPTHSLVTVTYGIPETNYKAPPISSNFDELAETIEPAAEFIRLDHRLFRWGSSTGDALKKEEAPGKLDVKVMLVRRITGLTTLPVLAVSAAGKVHDASYASTLGTFAAETLLYLEPTVEYTLSADGPATITYTQKWSINPHGWNKYYRAETDDWEFIYSIDRVSGGGKYNNYPPTDLSGLM